MGQVMQLGAIRQEPKRVAVSHVKHCNLDTLSVQLTWNLTQETFLPYYASQGYDTHAISFRQQGKSSLQSDSKVAGTLESHAEDLQHFVESLPEPPVIVAHSLSGLIAQRYHMHSCPNHKVLRLRYIMFNTATSQHTSASLPFCQLTKLQLPVRSALFTI